MSAREEQPLNGSAKIERKVKLESESQSLLRRILIRRSPGLRWVFIVYSKCLLVKRLLLGASQFLCGLSIEWDLWKAIRHFTHFTRLDKPWKIIRTMNIFSQNRNYRIPFSPGLKKLGRAVERHWSAETTIFSRKSWLITVRKLPVNILSISWLVLLGGLLLCNEVCLLKGSLLRLPHQWPARCSFEEVFSYFVF